MKKILFLGTLLLLVVVVLLVVVLSGCVRKDVDPYQTYRGKTSAELFTSGERVLAKKDYSEAVKNFEALDAIYPFGPHAEQAQLDIIYAYYKNNDASSGIVAADRYIRLYPLGRNLDYAYYMRGVIGFDLGLSWLQKLARVSPVSRDISTLQQSFTSFATLAELFPHSHYIPDALTRMCYIRNLMAQREIMIAKFYMKRRAYVAAANRGSYVVQHFQGSPQVAKALAIMVHAYQALGLPKMADASNHLLQTNYPHTLEARKLRKA